MQQDAKRKHSKEFSFIALIAVAAQHSVLDECQDDMHSVLASLVALTGSSQAGRTVLRESERLDTFATLSAGWWESAAKKTGFNNQAFFGTMSLVHTRPPASNAHR